MSDEPHAPNDLRLAGARAAPLAEPEACDSAKPAWFSLDRFTRWSPRRELRVNGRRFSRAAFYTNFAEQLDRLT